MFWFNFVLVIFNLYFAVALGSWLNFACAALCTVNMIVIKRGEENV